MLQRLQSQSAFIVGPKLLDDFLGPEIRCTTGDPTTTESTYVGGAMCTWHRSKLCASAAVRPDPMTQWADSLQSAMGYDIEPTVDFPSRKKRLQCLKRSDVEHSHLRRKVAVCSCKSECPRHAPCSHVLHPQQAVPLATFDCEVAACSKHPEKLRETSLQSLQQNNHTGTTFPDASANSEPLAKGNLTVPKQATGM